MKKIILIILLFSVSNLFAQNEQKYYTVNASTLNVRDYPDKEGIKLFELNYGDRVLVTENGGTWFKIEYKGKQGWVNNTYLIEDYNQELSDNSDNEEGSKGITPNPFLLYTGIIGGILLVLALILKGNALKITGAIITILATVFYYMFGLLLNAFSIALFATSNSSFLTSILATGFTYALSLVIFILSIVGFFKNTGIAIIVLSIIIIVINFLTGAIPGCIITIFSLFGGILIASGSAQLKNS